MTTVVESPVPPNCRGPPGAAPGSGPEVMLGIDEGASHRAPPPVSWALTPPSLRVPFSPPNRPPTTRDMPASYHPPVHAAGRGPVLGPMVYGCAYWPIAEDEEIQKYGFDGAWVGGVGGSGRGEGTTPPLHAG